MNIEIYREIEKERDREEGEIKRDREGERDGQEHTCWVTNFIQTFNI